MKFSENEKDRLLKASIITYITANPCLIMLFYILVSEHNEQFANYGFLTLTVLHVTSL